MKKINNKGYMLVEIVIASVLAVSICYYLLNLTYKSKNNNEDLFQSYLYTKDKTLVTKNIMQDLDKGEVMNLEVINGTEYKEFTFNLRFHGTNDLERRRLAVTKEAGKTTIEYGLVISSGEGLEDEEIFDYYDISYYKKQLSSNYIIGDLEYSSNKNTGTMTFKIPIKSIYSDIDYSIKLYADYFEPNLMKKLFSNSNSKEYYKNDLYREKIISTYFVDYINTTNAVTGAIWDVSKNEDGTIMAWLEKINIDNYILYIGSNRMIYAENLNYLCSDLLKLKNVSFNNLNTSLTVSMLGMFGASKSNNDINMQITSLDLSDFNTSNVTNMRAMFYGCAKLTSLDLSSFDTSAVINLSSMFYNCKSLTSLDLSKFNTKNVTEMHFMFRNCDTLTELDLSSFNVNNVKNMEYMFAECNNLKNIYLGEFNTLNLENMHGIFGNCDALENIKISDNNNLFNFNTSKVTDMGIMFLDCKKLKEITFGDNFKTDLVTDMRGMFQGCESLEILNLEKFNTGKVEYMNGMFANCTNLKNLILGSNFNTYNVKGFGEVDASISGYFTKGIIYGMFAGCEKINVTLTISCINDVSLDGIGKEDMNVFRNMFLGAATAEGAKIIVNYTTNTSTLVDNMIATGGTNVVKGTLVT